MISIMLKMVSVISLLGCFTFVAYANAGLIGERTPVWLAYRTPGLRQCYKNNVKTVKKPFNLTYTIQPRGIVKEAIDDWKAGKLFKLNEQIIYRTADWNVWGRGRREAVGPIEHTSNRTRRGRQEERTVHVLVAMDYPSSWPTSNNEADRKKYIKEKIVYAVAFWYGIHYRLKYFRNTSIRYKIRIVGIVIGANREATPYLRKHESDGTIWMGAASTEMWKYWKDVSNKNSDFPSDGHQLIATMTEMKSKAGNEWYTAGSGQYQSFLYFDNVAHGLNHVFTESSLKSLLATWSTRNFRNYGHLAPGTLIKHVPLPGQIVSLNQQCTAYDYKPTNWNCFKEGKTHPCRYMVCTNWAKDDCVIQVDRPLDGSTCGGEGSTNVCVNGECVYRSSVGY